MSKQLAPASAIMPCPIPLLIRHDSGSGFDRLIRTRDVVRVIPSVYVESGGWEKLAPWDRYLTKVHAVARIYPDAVFNLESAASLRGIAHIGSPKYVHILANYPSAARTTGLIQRHFYTDFIEPEVVEGISMTSTIDTAVDIARARHPGLALATLDHTIRAHGLTAGYLAATNDGRDSARGRANALWAIERATGIPESVLESLSIAEFEWLGFPAPVLQKQFDLGDLGGVPLCLSSSPSSGVDRWAIHRHGCCLPQRGTSNVS